jgi:WD40 repeat protein
MPVVTNTMFKLFNQRFLATPLLGLLLTACDSPPPSQSWENALQGTYSAAISNDGKFALIGSIYHGGSLWHIRNNERLYNWNHKAGEATTIIASGFSPEGDFAMTADHQTMVLWDTRTGESITYWTAPNEVMSLDLSPNGNFALLGLEDYSAVLFDVKRGGIKRTLYHQDRVRSVALSADGKLALTGSEDGSARFWNIENGEQLFLWQHEEEVLTVALAPLGDKAFTMSKYDRASIWNTRSGELIGDLPLGVFALKRGQLYTTAEFSSDGRLLLTGNSEQLVQLWDVETLTLLSSWTVPKRDKWRPTSASIEALSFASDDEFYAVASDGFTHRLTR